MENSSAKALSFPNWARLRRDKSNYPVWQRHILDVLQAISCEDTITRDYQDWAFDSDDSSSSEDDAVNFDADFSRMGLGGSRHSPQSSPTPTQQQLKQLYDSFQLMGKKEERVRKAQRKRRRGQRKFEEKKRRMDARARNAIHSTID